MKTKYRVALIALVALAVVFAIVPAALAHERSFPSVKVAGEVWFAQNGITAYSAFEAKAVGPAAPGEEHQPAEGVLTYRDQSGLRFRVIVEHIHAHSANEVHFGGMIVKASDSSLVGMHAHMVAVDNGRRGDLFSVLVTESDMHQHAPPVPVLHGYLVASVR